MSNREEDIEHEERPRIKVNDRRLFDSEGNVRTPNPEPDADPERDASRDRAAPAAPAPTPPPAAPPRAPEPAAPSTTAAPQSPTPHEPAAGPDDAGVPPRSDPRGSSPEALPRDFGSFIESQYYEALLYLGAIRHPATGQVVDEPEMAQYKIDLLTMLQEKTEGNRTPEETKMLDDVLYQLRMLFLQKSKVVKL